MGARRSAESRMTLWEGMEKMSATARAHGEAALGARRSAERRMTQWEMSPFIVT